MMLGTVILIGFLAFVAGAFLIAMTVARTLKEDDDDEI